MLPCLEALGASSWEDIVALHGVGRAEVDAEPTCSHLRLAQKRRLLHFLSGASPPPASPPSPPAYPPLGKQLLQLVGAEGALDGVSAGSIGAAAVALLGFRERALPAGVSSGGVREGSTSPATRDISRVDGADDGTDEHVEDEEHQQRPRQRRRRQRRREGAVDTGDAGDVSVVGGAGDASRASVTADPAAGLSARDQSHRHGRSSDADRSDGSRWGSSAGSGRSVDGNEGALREVDEARSPDSIRRRSARPSEDSVAALRGLAMGAAQRIDARARAIRSSTIGQRIARAVGLEDAGLDDDETEHDELRQLRALR